MHKNIRVQIKSQSIKIHFYFIKYIKKYDNEI